MSVFKKMGATLARKDIFGEFIGLWKVNQTGASQVLNALEKLSKSSDFKSMTCTDLFNEIAKEHTIAVKYISGAWLDVIHSWIYKTPENFVFNSNFLR